MVPPRQFKTRSQDQRSRSIATTGGSIHEGSGPLKLARREDFLNRAINDSCRRMRVARSPVVPG